MSPWPLNVFLAAPPISRTLAAVTFVFSVLIYTHILPFDLFDLSPKLLIQLPPQVWRIFTSLLITWAQFVYVYGAKLEIDSPRFSQRAEFVTYILFNCGVILLLNLFFTSGEVLAGPLGICFLTTWTRDAWDQTVTLFILTMPTQYLPYAILFLTLIVGSPKLAVIEATGLAAAHLYDLFTGLYPNSGIKRNLITTPGWIKKVFGTQSVVERPYGAATDKAAWGLDLSWKRFGPGHTLGGEGASIDRRRPGGLVLAAVIMGGFLMIFLIFGYFLMLQGGLDGWDWSFGFQKSSRIPVAGDDLASGKAIV